LDDLEKNYCSCKQEGRNIELSINGIYTCCLCHKEIFIHKQWKSPQIFKHTNIQNNNNHTLDLK